MFKNPNSVLVQIEVKKKSLWRLEDMFGHNVRPFLVDVLPAADIQRRVMSQVERRRRGTGCNVGCGGAVGMTC